MTSNNDRSTSQNSSADNGRVIPEAADEGKAVVDVRGRDIGTGDDVEGETMYVEPHASLPETVKNRLDWQEAKPDGLPVNPDLVEDIDERVVLAVERDEESLEES
jgi:hypothetical protein